MIAPPTTGGASLRVGVDLGGTGTRVIALTGTDDIAGDRIVETASLNDAAGPLERLARLISSVAAAGTVAGIGIGASGPVDSRGIVRNPDTLPLFSDIPLVALLAERFATHCAIESDAVTFALGEYRLGAGRGAETLIGVTLGTGIGACVLHDGHPHRGGDGLHPELGHIPVPGGPARCYCGLESCWEQLASRTALEVLAANAGFASVEAAAVAAVSGFGDPKASAVFEDYGRAVGIGLASLCTVFRPDRIIIGGGVTPYFTLFYGGLRTALARAPSYAVEPEVFPAALGAIAGAVGAATLTDPGISRN